MATGGKTQEISPSSLELPYHILSKITKDFSDDKILGASQFGILYKGTREDGTEIAVKKLREYTKLPADKTFKKEVVHIMELTHENIVKLVGFCIKEEKKVVEINNKYILTPVITERFLCCEYFPKGSLYECLFGNKAAEESTSAASDIDWVTRFKIVKGVCQGLLFLHNLDGPIIHMDLNLKSIWLGENMVPKIGNFGLSRLFGHQQTRVNTGTVVGSYGYMAPEYVHNGEISAQADIYSLGLMIIEISTREKNIQIPDDPAGRGYIDKIRSDWTAEHIASEYPTYDAESLQQVYACIEIGLECVQLDRTKRPPIEEIVDRLETI